MPPYHLRWLQIHAYEQFEPVRIEFSSRENLLLGVNGAGKTRLLKLIQAVLTLDFRELLERSFDVEFEVAADTLVDGSEMVTAGRVRYERAFERPEADDASTSSGLVAAMRCRSATVDLQYEVKGQEVVYRLASPALEERVTWKSMGLVRPGVREVKSGVLRRIFVAIAAAADVNYLGESDHQVRALIEDLAITFYPPSRWSLQVQGSVGPSLLRELAPLIARLAVSAKESVFHAGLELTSLLPDEADAIAALLRPLGVISVQLVPNVVGTTATEIECRGVGLKAVFGGGVTLADSKLTFGQRRYLYAGIVSLVHPPVPVLVDEIDNGMHPRLVETLLNLWGDRQLFLVSHNKMVIDYTNFDSVQDVQEKIHIVQRDAEGRQRVSLLDAETAGEIFKKIEVAIQNPSDVLRAEGLW